MVSRDEHLRDVLDRLAPGKYGTADEDDSLGDASDEGEAFNSRTNKQVYTLHCNLGPRGYRSFQYVHLDSDSSFAVDGMGQVIVLRFAGMRPVKLTIRGRNLFNLYDYLHQHKVQRINVADRDFAQDGQPIVTSIDIEDAVEEAARPWQEFVIPANAPPGRAAGSS